MIPSNDARRYRTSSTDGDTPSPGGISSFCVFQDFLLERRVYDLFYIDIDISRLYYARSLCRLRVQTSSHQPITYLTVGSGSILRVSWQTGHCAGSPETDTDTPLRALDDTGAAPHLGFTARQSICQSAFSLSPLSTTAFYLTPLHSLSAVPVPTPLPNSEMTGDD
jgi:hypothetical protein